MKKTAVLFGVVLGAIGFFLIYLIGKNFIIGLVSGFAIYSICYFIFSRESDESKYKTQFDPKTDYKHVTSKGAIKLHEIKKFKSTIEDKDVSICIDNIIIKAESIFGFIERNPDNIEQVRTFMEYYLPAVSKVLYNYTSILKSNLNSEQSKDFCEKVIVFLNEVDKAFAKQLDSLFENKILDASIEMEALKSSMISEGLIDKYDLEQE